MVFGAVPHLRFAAASKTIVPIVLSVAKCRQDTTFHRLDNCSCIVLLLHLHVHIATNGGEKCGLVIGEPRARAIRLHHVADAHPIDDQAVGLWPTVIGEVENLPFSV